MRVSPAIPAILVLACAALAQPDATPRAVVSFPSKPSNPSGGSRLANEAQVRKRLGLPDQYGRADGIENIKIAVLDYGFDGVGTRRYLPDSAVVVEHYDPDFVRRFKLGDPDYKKPFAPGNRHGRAMAQIIWSVTGSNPQGPKFYLLNANGPTMLRRAVRYAIESKVDIILFSDVFEGGGNGDGRGPINRTVADALDAGIIWVNAAGNYGKHVYNGPVTRDADGWLRFRPGDDGTSLRFRNLVDENTVTITLTWNDYREEEDAGTDKDLDLYVEDPAGKRLGAGEKIQIAGNREPGPNETRNPRERIILENLPANADFNFRIRIKAKGINFTPTDRVRVLVTATKESYMNPQDERMEEAVRFFDATGQGEIYPPADNARVITVADGSEGSSKGPTTDHRKKPDVQIDDSRAYFSDGEISAGASNAAAYLAGVVGVLKAVEPKLSTQHIFQLIQNDIPAGPTQQTQQPQHGQQWERIPSPRRVATQLAPETYRYYSDPARASLPRVRSSGDSVILEGRRFRITGDLSGPSLSIARQVPKSPSTSTSARTPPVPARTQTQSTPVWQTPTRERLAEVVGTSQERP